MIFVCLYLLFLIQGGVPLKCFQCSLHDKGSTNECPTSSDSYTNWISSSARYTEFGSSTTNACTIRVAGNGKIYHQGGVVSATCSNAQAIAYMKQLVDSDSGTSGAQFACCYTDGCNWNLEYAKQNRTGGESSSLTAAVPYVLAILAALLVVGLCLLFIWLGACAICCVCCAKDDNDEKQSGKVKQKSLDQININERYKSIRKQQRSLTPIGEESPQLTPNYKSAGQSTISTTIDVEPTSWVDVPQQPPTTTTNHNTEVGAAQPTERPIGPKPAKVVDAQSINLSAFLHFAPKSATENKTKP